MLTTEPEHEISNLMLTIVLAKRGKIFVELPVASRIADTNCVLVQQERMVGNIFSQHATRHFPAFQHVKNDRTLLSGKIGMVGD